MSIRRFVLVWLMSLCGLVGVCVFGGAPAGAAITHDYLSRITEIPAGPGVSSSGPLENPQALTVDAGSLYVADGPDKAHGRLDKLNASTGAVELQFEAVPSLSYMRQGVAVAHGSGEVYLGADEFVGGVPHGVVAVFDAAGHLQKVWQGTDTPAGGFGCFECSGPGDVAVDNDPSSLNDWAAGNVYVAAPEQGGVDVFKPKAGGEEEYVTRIAEREPGVPLERVVGVAVDPSTGDVLVIDANGVDVFEPTVLDQYVLVRRLSETEAGQPFGSITGLAVDGGDGDVYVAEAINSNTVPRAIRQFSATGVYLGGLQGTPTGPFGTMTASVAVDSSTHDVYVGDSREEHEAIDIFGETLTIPDVVTEGFSGLKVGAATLHGMVGPDAIQLTDCRFDYGASTSYGQSAPCVPAAASIPADSHTHPVTAQLAGLAPDTTYHYRLQASNSNGTNPESGYREFTTPGPGIHNTSALDVTSDSATLAASIDPNETAATYYFQYGTSTSYGSDVPAAPAPVGSGKGDIEVSEPVHLSSDTLYHYRVVVRSEPLPGEPLEEAGPDETFTTQSAGVPGLIDGRAWEMVSPPDKHGAALETLSPIGGGLIQASRDGSAIAYLASGSIENEPAGNRSFVYTQVLSTRGSQGWTSKGIAAPNQAPAFPSTLNTGEYKLFSPDLTEGLIEQNDNSLLAPGAATRSPYLRETDGQFKPLLLANELPSGSHITRGELFHGATPDLSHIILESGVPLVAGVPNNGLNSLYEWSKGRLQVASILPNGKQTSEENMEAEFGKEGFAVRHAISDDGSRVIWTAHPAGEDETHLYLRDMTLGKTVQLDVAESGAKGGGEGPVFQIANSEGSKVFFTDVARLTTNATSRPGEPDFYMCEVSVVAGEPRCALKDLSVDDNRGEAANMEGIVLAAGEDGRYVYFAANGALAPGAAKGDCINDKAAGGYISGSVCNLYVYDTTTDTIRLVAAVSNQDDSNWETDNGGAPIPTTVRVSPSGRYLAFMSERSLTGYDNIDTNSSQRDVEVYLYDADTGRLVCASCNPSGARSIGVYDQGEEYDFLAYNLYASYWGGHWLAGSIPGWEAENEQHRNTWYQPDYLSDSGRLFFDSPDALVPGDINGKEDVYEYEPDGVGSCAGVSGCIGLISSGTSGEESVFLDASESGNDVFFLTSARLVPQDVDNAFDVYDAHVCSEGSPCVSSAAVSPVACVSSVACRGGGGALPGAVMVPASAGVEAGGNLVPQSSVAPPVAVKRKGLTRAQKLATALRLCRRRARRRRLLCETRARRLYGKSAAARDVRGRVVGRGVVKAGKGNG
jgi:hypothetical protein